jgi:hypothetical protein
MCAVASFCESDLSHRCSSMNLHACSVEVHPNNVILFQPPLTITVPTRSIEDVSRPKCSFTARWNQSVHLRESLPKEWSSCHSTSQNRTNSGEFSGSSFRDIFSSWSGRSAGCFADWIPPLRLWQNLLLHAAFQCHYNHFLSHFSIAQVYPMLLFPSIQMCLAKI